MDAVARQFAALAEADGKVRVRFHPVVEPPLHPQEQKNWHSTEREMTYRQYRIWLSNAQANGLVLERVETVKRPD